VQRRHAKRLLSCGVGFQIWCPITINELHQLVRRGEIQGAGQIRPPLHC
jgi:hypothetical protein